jgi:hypothetical protein
MHPPRSAPRPWSDRTLFDCNTNNMSRDRHANGPVQSSYPITAKVGLGPNEPVGWQFCAFFLKFPLHGGIARRVLRCPFQVGIQRTGILPDDAFIASRPAEHVACPAARCLPKFGNGPPPRTQMTTSSPTRRGRHSACSKPKRLRDVSSPDRLHIRPAHAPRLHRDVPRPIMPACVDLRTSTTRRRHKRCSPGTLMRTNSPA